MENGRRRRVFTAAASHDVSAVRARARARARVCVWGVPIGAHARISSRERITNVERTCERLAVS